MNIKISSSLLGFLLSTGILAQDLPATFAPPIFLSDPNSACDAETTRAGLSPDKRELSVLFPRCFLEVGQSGVTKSAASCKFDLVFVEKLSKPETVRIDVRGSELKDAPVRVKYSISLGDQTHNFEYEKGRVISGSDPSQADFVRRFELSNIPAGTKKIHISFQGKAKSYEKQSLGLAHIDSLDACLADPQDNDQLGCGGTAKAQLQQVRKNNCLNPDIKTNNKGPENES